MSRFAWWSPSELPYPVKPTRQIHGFFPSYCMGPVQGIRLFFGLGQLWGSALSWILSMELILSFYAQVGYADNLWFSKTDIFKVDERPQEASSLIAEICTDCFPCEASASKRTQTPRMRAETNMSQVGTRGESRWALYTIVPQNTRTCLL